MRFPGSSTVVAGLVSGAVLLSFIPDAEARPGWCKRAHTTAHRVICSDPSLWVLDRCEEALYGQVRRMAKRSVLKAVAQNEADWVRRRNRCRANYDCIVDQYADRIDELQEITRTKC
ncbi:MAG: lysozyme inhibitor LprI family protein [Hyphomicrobiaceae bacterium]